MRQSLFKGRRWGNRGKRAAAGSKSRMSLHCRRLACEPLEDRRLLSGVTLITHGFGGEVDGWVRAMSRAISERPDLDRPLYVVEVDDPGHDDGPLEVFQRSYSAPLTNVGNPEIVILLDWSDVAGSVSLDGHVRSTVDVAAAVAQKLVTPNFLSGLPTAVAELPLHLIGHSRGASLVGQLAHDLGELGIWVDQVTTLDPHPVDDWDDAQMTGWENVVFWDNYRQDSLYPTGFPVDGTFQRYLGPGYLSGGYPISNHSDVHLWYHGTIDTDGDISDGGVDDFDPDDEGWYDGNMGPRDQIGYYFSRIVGGTRSTEGQSSRLEGTAVRVPIGDLTSAAWPNLFAFDVAGNNGTFFIGTSVDTTFYHQDLDSTATVTFYLDTDRNPYNDTPVLAGTKAVRETGIAPLPVAASMFTHNASPGSYYVSAQIRDAAGHTRYAYAPDRITLQNTPPGTALSIGSTPWDDSNPQSDRDGVVEEWERADLEIRLSSNRNVTGVEAVLMSGFSGVNVSNAENQYGSISAGGISDGDGGYSIDLDLNATNGVQFLLFTEYRVNGVPYSQVLTFDKDVLPQRDWASFQIPTDTSYTIDDSTSISSYANNGNGVFESGETVRIKPLLKYSGISTAEDPDLTLIYDGPVITVLTGDERYPDLAPDQSAYPANDRYFVVRAAANGTGSFMVDGQVDWDQSPDPYLMENALRLDVAPAPWLNMATNYDFGVVEPGDPVPYTLTVRNNGTADLRVDDIVLPANTIANLTSFTVSAGGTQEIEITINTTGIQGQITRDIQLVTASDVRPYVDAEKQLTITGLVSANIPIFQVPNTETSEESDISGEWIVWNGNRDGQWDIFAYNIATNEERQITNDAAVQYSPRVSGNLIAWSDLRNGGRDIYGYDLSASEEFVISDDPWLEGVVGVAGGKVAFRRAYYDFTETTSYDYAWNLWLYDHSTGQENNVTGFTPNSSHNPMQTTQSDADFGEGFLVWDEAEIFWETRFTNPYWSGRDSRSMKMKIGADSQPVRALDFWVWMPSADDNRFVHVDDYEDPQGYSGDQIWLWENGSNRHLTEPGAQDVNHADDVLAIGGDFVVYDKYQGQELFYWDLGANQSQYQESLLTDQVNNAEEARMDNNAVVWRGMDPTDSQWHIYYTFIQQPDIAVTFADPPFSNDNPLEGDSIDVSVTVKNLTDYAQTGGITVRLYDGDPDSGGTQMGSKTVSGGLGTQPEAMVQFAGIILPDNAGGTAEESHAFYARVSVPGYDYPDNNTDQRDLVVRDNDTEGPTISAVRVEEYQGDNDGIIGADEQVRISWDLSAPSGIGLVELRVDGQLVPLTGDYYAILGPLGQGPHDFRIDAEDADNSPASSPPFEDTFEVVSPEEITVRYEGEAIVDDDSVPIDVGSFVLDSPDADLVFIVRNDGEQDLAWIDLTITATEGAFLPPTDPTPTSIIGGGVTFFTVTPDTTVLGRFSGDVSLGNSDSGENPFDFTITGEVVEASALIEMSLVRQPTVFDEQYTGEVSALTDNEQWIDEWTSFYVEIWVSTPDTVGMGVVSAAADLTYNTDYFTATGIEYGPAFTENQTGSIDDAAGLVDDLGAETLATDVGDDGYAMLARVRFEPTVDDPGVPLGAEGKYITPVVNEFTLDAGEVTLVGDIAAQVELGNLPDTELWPVMYDIDDDGRIGFGDFAFFATAFQQTVGNPGATYGWAADFDHDGRIGFGDFAFLATNFQHTKTGGIPLDYPPNFPDAWQPSPLTLETPSTLPQGSAALLTDQKLSPIVAEAIHRLETSAGSEAGTILENVTVEIADLPGDRLGQSSGNHVWIDLDAAGYGWFVDTTPWDDLEFSRRTGTDTLTATLDSAARRRVDLLTTLMHEFGHVLDFEHTARDNAMHATLPLGTRRVLSEDWLFSSSVSDEEDGDDFWEDERLNTEALDEVFSLLGTC